MPALVTHVGTGHRAGAAMDRHAANRRLKRLAKTAGVRLSQMHPHTLRHTFVATMQSDARVSLRVVQIAARHADPANPYDHADEQAMPSSGCAGLVIRVRCPGHATTGIGDCIFCR